MNFYNKMFAHNSIIFFSILIKCSFGSLFNADPGPWVIATQGEPWPMPAYRVKFEGFVILQPTNFKIMVNISCDILLNAKARYESIILREARLSSKVRERQPKLSNHQNINTLDVYIKPNGCESYPYLHMDESYNLMIDDGEAILYAPSVWGALRGLDTFSQLLIPSGERFKLAIMNQQIIDSPNLPHRGLLLDTSRHFFPIEDILLTLDAMSYNKLNVFHWHIIDDNSFPYESTKFPELSLQGAWHPTMIYTPNNIRHIIEYARLRGIRVMPEFDTPGHVASWGLSHPELLTKCYDSAGKPNGHLGPINPINPAIWPFLKEFLTEAMTVFSDYYIHLGGDEVPFDCWQSNPEIVEYMKENKIVNDFKGLESKYITELLKIPASKNVSSIVWQEVFDNGVELLPKTVVHVWTGDWSDNLSRVTKAGHPALLSACWYLDHIASGGDWKKYYRCDPLNFDGSDAARHLMLGGEACMWSEFVNRNNLHSRIWPRASAVAERLWSHEFDIENATPRLEEHACRMNRRFIHAQPPNGPNFCVT